MPADGVGVTLITGGASGLGAATAHAVAEAGGTPVVLDLNPARDGHAHELVDLADPRAAEAAVARAIDAHGDPTGVVTAAATDTPGRLEEVPGATWDRILAVNLLGTAAVVRAALPALERARGTVVTVTSTLGFKAVSDATAYCASKFGVVGFTRALADETAGRVGVTLLVPGGMRTSFFDTREERYRPPPDATLNDPADVAAAIVFALRQPAGCELREMVVTPSVESSWPP